MPAFSPSLSLSCVASSIAVSRQAYYDWRSRPPSTRELRDVELKALPFASPSGRACRRRQGWARCLRNRLDRGGDRQLNRALHTIVISRRKHHPETIAYLERRQREGKTDREAIRCLKRYLARSLYRLLERTAVAA